MKEESCNWSFVAKRQEIDGPRILREAEKEGLEIIEICIEEDVDEKEVICLCTDAYAERLKDLGDVKTPQIFPVRCGGVLLRKEAYPYPHVVLDELGQSATAIHQRLVNLEAHKICISIWGVKKDNNFSETQIRVLPEKINTENILLVAQNKGLELIQITITEFGSINGKQCSHRIRLCTESYRERLTHAGIAKIKEPYYVHTYDTTSSQCGPVTFRQGTSWYKYILSANVNDLHHELRQWEQAHVRVTVWGEKQHSQTF